MTCLFCRCNTWASKHRPATIKSKQQTVQHCHQILRGSNLCLSKLFSLQPSTSRRHTQTNVYILQLPPRVFFLFSPLTLALSAGLPAATTTFIHALCLLAYSKGQGSATMTTGTSADCGPPINTSDTCGVKKKRDLTKWETSTVCSQQQSAFWIKAPTEGSSPSLNCSIFSLRLLQHFQHWDYFRFFRG